MLTGKHIHIHTSLAQATKDERPRPAQHHTTSVGAATISNVRAQLTGLSNKSANSHVGSRQMTRDAGYRPHLGAAHVRC
eukprot:scaffold16154_cov122-Isochrysis_galbana.AAC.2